MIVSLGWWVAVVELVPASWRPYIGGSTNNSVLDLVFGYNGLARILGDPGGGGAGGGGGGFGGTPGLTRLFEQVSGGMITWLLPAALLLAGSPSSRSRRAPRTDGRARRAHPVDRLDRRHRPDLLAHGRDLPRLLHRGPGPGDRRGRSPWREPSLWQRGRTPGWVGQASRSPSRRTAVWAFVLLGPATGVYESLRWPVLVVGVVAALALLVAHRLPRLAATVVLAVALAGAADRTGGVRAEHRRPRRTPARS